MGLFVILCTLFYAYKNIILRKAHRLHQTAQEVFQIPCTKGWFPEGRVSNYRALGQWGRK